MTEYVVVNGNLLKKRPPGSREDGSGRERAFEKVGLTTLVLVVPEERGLN